MTSIPRPAPGVLVAEFTDDGYELVVHRTGERSTFLLAGTAAALWLMIDGTNTTEQIVADLAEAYGTDPGSISADVAEALDVLDHCGLVAADIPKPAADDLVLLPRPADP